MKLVLPKPFTFQAGERAVLLLHGFTGSSADVRMLGRFLEKKGYTCHAPHYKGHGVPPEELMHTGPEDWWQDVLRAYTYLKEEGHNKIAVVGLSLGGVFALKLAATTPVLGIVPMCAPMYIKSEEVMHEGILAYATEFKKREGKSPEQIASEMSKFAPMTTLKEVQQLISDTRQEIDTVYAPTFVVQARHDEMINTDSANIIFNNVEAHQKQIKWYENSSHVITIDQEKEQLHEDVYMFLDSLDW